jgi:pyruvate/2-oxoglutarate dehydrogenase complex dihydrolipoamide acyltransferase (E2) component
MFAGRMKLKTFLAIVGVGGATALSGGAYMVSQLPDPTPTPAPTPPPVAAATPKPSVKKKPTVDIRAPEADPSKMASVRVLDLPAKRDVDRALVPYIGKDLGTSKKKDVTSGKPYKVNVYQDDGHATANRAKVDLDRDDQWDEKWTFGDELTRKIAPDDDENYTIEQVWRDRAWHDR